MSKAFTKDDDGAAPQFVRSRAPLPRGVPNYVTSRGLAALRDERLRLEAERGRWEGMGDAAAAAAEVAKVALTARMVELDTRIGSAVVVAAPTGEGRETIRFGASVVIVDVDDGDVERRFQIVGVDEADAASGRIAFTAPLARALLGRRVGDRAQVGTAGDEAHSEAHDEVHSEEAGESWLIRSIGYDAV